MTKLKTKIPVRFQKGFAQLEMEKIFNKAKTNKPLGKMEQSIYNLSQENANKTLEMIRKSKRSIAIKNEKLKQSSFSIWFDDGNFEPKERCKYKNAIKEHERIFKVYGILPLIGDMFRCGCEDGEFYTITQRQWTVGGIILHIK